MQISAVDAKIQPEEAPFELNTQSTECARICYEAKLFQEKKRRQENCGVPVASAASTLHSLLVMNKTAESKQGTIVFYRSFRAISEVISLITLALQ